MRHTELCGICGIRGECAEQVLKKMSEVMSGTEALTIQVASLTKTSESATDAYQ